MFETQILYSLLNFSYQFIFIFYTTTFNNNIQRISTYSTENSFRLWWLDVQLNLHFNVFLQTFKTSTKMNTELKT